MLKNYRSIKCIHTQRGFYSKVWLKVLFKLVASHLYLIIVFIFLMAGCLCSLKLLQYRQHKYASAIYSNNDHIEKVREDEERKQKKLFWNSKIKLRVSKPFAVTICKQRFLFRSFWISLSFGPIMLGLCIDWYLTVKHSWSYSHR